MIKWKKSQERNLEIRQNPLLVSVRSGARASMPGMMDTILNLGLNEEVVETLAEAPEILVGHGTATEDSSRCSLT